MRRDPALSTPKLMQVALSACFVFFAFFALVVAGDAIQTPAWFDGKPHGFGLAYDYLIDPLAPLLMVGFFAFPLGIWHFCDLFSKGQSRTKAGWIANSYRLVMALVAFGLFGAGILLSGFTEWLSCWYPEPSTGNETGNTFGYLCTPDPVYLIEFLVLPFFLGLVALVLLKTIVLVAEKVGVEI